MKIAMLGRLLKWFFWYSKGYPELVEVPTGLLRPSGLAMTVRSPIFLTQKTMQLLIRWLLYSVAIIISAYLLPGVHVSNFWAAFVAALVLGILNALVKPILILLTLPINILTLGLFTFVINALMILLASSIVKGFTVESFGWAFLFAIILSVVNAILSRLVK